MIAYVGQVQRSFPSIIPVIDFRPFMDEEFNQAMPNITVLPLTSTQRRLYPSEVLLPSGIAGQPLDSIVMAHQIRTISKQRLGKLLGYLDDDKLQHEVYKAIKEHLDME